MTVTVEILRPTPSIYREDGHPIEPIVGRKYELDDETAARLIRNRFARAVDE
ncbi:MAG: hypothetical protein A4E30_00285 [Methanomassiliicoccales archaeon PtaB.Bin215]|nr:MAG: hypothetical protein A4E30_00285 [Methanomassiliicoccales archaeon PtaB.Bin215]